ncbi:glutathione S-transferase family protein [Microcoleus sp. FACHB-68]|nr:glutathione S-transferase family protein [Microcoleus sp. FACHB-68]
MSELTLVIGNKNYSSWSLRAWLAVKQAGVDFTEVRIPLQTPTSQQEILRYSPSGKVPFLQHGEVRVWDSLAICEYVAEQFAPAFWPENPAARAIARSISAEMHAGFPNLRENMSMNCRARLPGKGMETGVREEIDRITAIWRECRQNFGSGGDLLFGHFTLADAMFAPVVSRFVTYDVKLEPVAKDYADAIWALPAMQEWVAAAQAEPEVIAHYEV